jgi:hypothetical protein
VSSPALHKLQQYSSTQPSNHSQTTSHHPLLQVRSLWLSNNDIGLHGLIMLADFLAAVRVC